MLSAGLYTLLSTDPSLVVLIAGRVSPVMLPQNATLPAITYQIVGGSTNPTFEGSGMQKVRVQFDCFGAVYGDAENVRDALRKLLNGFQGTLSDGTVLQNADLIQETDFFDQDARNFRCMAEYYFYFNFTT